MVRHAMSTTRSTRVAVLGAGLAGLAAANRLADAGLDVTVLEARHRVGGRVWSQTLSVDGRDCVAERGAEFVLDGYATFRELAASFGLSLVDTGMSYYVRELAETPHITTDLLADAGRRSARLAHDLGRRASVDEVLSMLDLPREVDEAVRSRIEVSCAATANDVDASALDHVASFEPLPSYRLAGGNQRLADELARRLGPAVRLGEVVVAVDPHEAGVRVRTVAAETDVDHVVVALPLGVLVGGEVTVPVTDARWSAMGRLTQGQAAKLHIPLTTPAPTSAVLSVPGRFWTWTAVDAEGTVAPAAHQLRGLGARPRGARGPRGPAALARRRTHHPAGPSRRRAGSDPHLLGGRPVRVRRLRSTESPDVTGRRDQRVLEASDGPIDFAGEYADGEYTGLMEGALRSGLRAADSVLRRVEHEAAG